MALDGFLDRQRAAIIRKIDGLDDATARKAPTASALSLLGIAKHCALWERRWFQVIAAGRKFPGGRASDTTTRLPATTLRTRTPC
jgi:Protein of unknown function (DUF664)